MFDVFKKQPKITLIRRNDEINGVFQYFPKDLVFDFLTSSFEITDEDFKILKKNLTTIRDKYSFELKLPNSKYEGSDAEKIKKLADRNSELAKEKANLENKLIDLKFNLDEKEEMMKKIELDNRNLVQNLLMNPNAVEKIEEKDLEESKTVEIGMPDLSLNLMEKEITSLKNRLKKSIEETEVWKEKTKKYKQKFNELKENMKNMEEENNNNENKYKEKKKEDKKKIDELNILVEKLQRKKAELKSKNLSLKATLELGELSIKKNKEKEK